MDTKIIQQYGDALLSYRIRTARQKIRMQYEDFDKQLIQLNKQEHKLYQQKRDLGWQTLDTPYQKGWVRHFVLRADIAAGFHAQFFEAILKKINTFQYNWRKDFKRRKRKGGKKNYLEIPQALLKPVEWKFKQLEFTEAEKQFFHEVWETNAWDRLEKRYVFNDPAIFILKVSPNMIDKVNVSDSELESAIKLLDNYLQKNDYRKHQQKILHGHYHWRGRRDLEKHGEKNLLKEKQVGQILDMIEEEIAAHTNR